MSFSIRTPTKDMWDLCQQKLRDAGYLWTDSGNSYVEYGNANYIQLSKEGKITLSYNYADNKIVSYTNNQKDIKR